MSWYKQLFSRRRLYGDLSEEIRGHLEEKIEELMANGMSKSEATATARREFGNVTLLEQDSREIWQWLSIETFFADLRFSLRMLKRNPGFTTLAVLSLALGIGGNAAMFTILNAVLIRPLPYLDAGRLVQTTNTGYYPPGGVVALQQGSRTMDLAGYDPGMHMNLTGQNEAWRLTGSSVSANLFTVLGVEVEFGRVFRMGEDQSGKDNLVILSHSLWQDKFGSDRGIIGRVVTLGGVDRQVVGVMPRVFAFPDTATQFWIPLHLDPRDPSAYWAMEFMPVIARLRGAATLLQAQSEIRSLSSQMIDLFPYPMGRNWNAEATVLPLQQFMVTNLRARLIALQCATGLVLLIACANVASLLLARATSRQKEMALRAALGAARGRIARQLLTESVTLGLAGGALGIALALLGFSVLKMALPVSMAGWSDISIDWHVLVFAIALSVLTGLAFGLAPAISASTQDLAGAIKTGGLHSGGTARTRLRSALVMGEVALTVVLSVSAGLLIKSLWMLAQVNPGFQPERLFTLRVSPNQGLCRERAACVALYDELLRRTKSISGVYDAAAANTLPLASDIPSLAVRVEGQSYLPQEHTSPLFWFGAVTPEYFRLLHIPILQGRAFADSDAGKSAAVVIVSAATARHYWPGQNPIGKHVWPVWEDNWRTVVGVAGDVRQYDLADHSPDYIQGAMYMPYPQSVDSARQLPATMMLIVRTGADPIAVASGIHQIMIELNPNAPMSEIRTMEALVNESTQQSRSMMWLFVTFAGAALLLAAVGTYGVVSYSSAQRTFEIGMRVTLGATKRNIFSLVLGQSLRLVLAGLGLGVVTSLVLTRMLVTFLYGTAATDPFTFLAVGGLLIVVALLAGYLPARRAAHLDPLDALRVE